MSSATSLFSPILATLSRGVRVESFHRGALVVARADGAIVASLGDRDRRVFPRSAIKSIQALPLVMSGAADHFGFGDRELALACASHSGAPSHATLAGEILGRLQLAPGDLACGAHLPLGEDYAHAMLRAGETPSRLHNNCSGKHCGMLATAAHLGETASGYEHPDHPVQKRIRTALHTVTGVEIPDGAMGIDGCSVPNWALPLTGLATGFARMVSAVSGEGPLPEPERAAARRLIEACWAAPVEMAGEGRLDTSLLRRFKGEVFLKTGAEGVYCGGVVSQQLGFALKIDDGAKRAAETVVCALIGALVQGADDLLAAVPLKNWDGRVVGETRISGELSGLCAELRQHVTR